VRRRAWLGCGARPGQSQQARDFLAPTYSGFIEGFSTPDLKDAKALIDELAQ